VKTTPIPRATLESLLRTLDGELSEPIVGDDPPEPTRNLALVDRDLNGGRRQSPDVVTRFESGYRRMLEECARILKPRHPAFLMVGNPTVRTQRAGGNAPVHNRNAIAPKWGWYGGGR
jgi:hypothetical protein